MFELRDWFRTTEAEHDEEWMHRVTRHVRWYMTPLVSIDEARLGMAYLNGEQSMLAIENLFQNPISLNLNNDPYANNRRLFDRYGNAAQSERPADMPKVHWVMGGIRFKSVPLLPKMRNVLVGEMKKMGVMTTVQATDPASQNKKLYDRLLLKNKAKLEQDISYNYQQLGQKPYRLNHHKARFGEKVGNGNIDKFEDMGLDHTDPQDLDMFFKMFHKLREEMSIQKLIDFVLKYNNIENNYTEKWVDDILAKYAIGAQPYINEVTGTLDIRYLSPESIYIYGATGRDQTFNDSNAKVYEQRMTIKEMLQTIGNSFDVEQQWEKLLCAIAYVNGIEFTGIQPSLRGLAQGDTYSYKGGTDYDGNLVNGNTKCGYNDFMQFKVIVGYIEVNSQIDEGLPVEVSGKNLQSNTSYPEDRDHYAKRPKYETPTYKAHYLAVSSIDQVMFNFGKIKCMDITGYSDVNTNFTIQCWKGIGLPLALQCREMVDFANELFWKLKYVVRRSKPPGTDYNLSSLLEVLDKMIDDPLSNEKNSKIMQLVNYLDVSANGIWDFPKLNGLPVGMSNNQLNIEKQNGMGSSAKEYWDLYLSVVNHLWELIGFAPLRQGDPGGNRDSATNQVKALESSESATYFVPDAISMILEQISQRITTITQSVVHDSKDSMIYQFLLNGIGQEPLDDIEALGYYSNTRYGLFFDSVNLLPLKQKLDAVLIESIKTKAITTAQSLLVQDIKNPREAFQVLAYLEQKNAKDAQKQQMQLAQQQQQHQQQLAQMQMQGERMKVDGNIVVAKIQGANHIQGNIVNAKSGITKQAMKKQADIEQAYHDAMADLYREQGSVDESVLNTPTPTIPPAQQPNANEALASGLEQAQQGQPNDGMIPAGAGRPPIATNPVTVGR